VVGSEFLGRTAVITGSARGLGKATALKLAEQGAALVINARSSRELVDETVREIRAIGAKAIGVLADVTNPEDVELLAARAREEFGHVDLLVNNVGLRPIGRILDLSFEDWKSVVSFKLDSAFLCCQAFIPDMKAQRYGRIVNVSGIDAFWGNAKKLHVGTSNFALVGLSRGLAIESAEYGITVNTLVPGSFDTQRANPDWYAGRDFEELMTHIPMRRQGKPSELAAVCRFLLHEDAGYITGQTIHVNGGAYPSQPRQL
jgi:3-oxoacyl-[acyl-carrier protein] reductase